MRFLPLNRGSRNGFIGHLIDCRLLCSFYNVLNVRHNRFTGANRGPDDKGEDGGAGPFGETAYHKLPNIEGAVNRSSHPIIRAGSGRIDKSHTYKHESCDLKVDSCVP